MYARLGSMKLGYTPFIYRGDEQMIKAAEVSSVQSNLTNFLSNETKDKISYVIINDTYRVDSFVNKKTEDNIVVLEYNVTQNMGVDQINNIKIYDEENNLLLSSNLYVPIVEDTLITHRIRVEEGV